MAPTRAALVVAAQLAQSRGNDYSASFWQGLDSFRCLEARLALAQEVVVFDLAQQLSLSTEPDIFDEDRTVTTEWRKLFLVRLETLSAQIQRITEIGTIALSGDLGEGKGSVASRFRKAERLIAQSTDDAQKLRYAEQVVKLRDRVLTMKLPDDDCLFDWIVTLKQRLWRVCQAWRALSEEEQDELRKAYKWKVDPEYEEAFFWSLDIDHQLFSDLGV